MRVSLGSRGENGSGLPLGSLSTQVGSLKEEDLMADGQQGEVLAVAYPMRRSALFMAMAGIVAAAAGGNGWWVAGVAWLTAGVLFLSQQNRRAQVAQHLRVYAGESDNDSDRQAFTLYWKHYGREGECEFSSLANAAKAANRLVETKEADGPIECYEMTWLPRVGKIPTRWMRWSTGEASWSDKWSAGKSDIGVIVRQDQFNKEMAAQASAANWSMR